MRTIFSSEKEAVFAELKLLKNTYILNESKDNIQFSKNTNTYIRRVGIQSYLLRHFYILNLLMLNKAVTLDFILDFYENFGNDPAKRPKEELRAELYQFLKRLEERTWLWFGKKYTGVITHNPGAYFNVETTYEITPVGLEYLKAINESLEFEAPVHKLTSEEYTRLSAHKNKRKGDNNHAIFVMLMVSGVLGKLNLTYLDDFAIETGRGANYMMERDIRSNLYKVPDASFIYETSNIFDANVSLEADLLNEKGMAFTQKLLDDLTYNDKQTRQYSQFPSMVFYVLGQDMRSFLKSSTNEHHKEKNVISSKLKKNIERCLYMCHLLNVSVSEDITISEVFRYLERAGEKEKSGPIFYNKDENKQWFKELNDGLKYFEQYNGKLSVGRYMDISGNTISSNKKNVNAIKASCSKFSNRRRNAYKVLIETEGVDKMFKKGHSIVMANYWELDKVIPSVLPYIGGRDNVRAALQAIGLPDSWKKFWPSLPLYKAPDEFCINMRNCFLSDGVFVSIEDATYDISALSRIREYVSNPTGIIRNAMLCIIINDDLTLANGTSLEDTNYWQGKYLDAQDTFKECIVREFGKRGKIPYKYRIAADFCFIRRSEYLTADSEKIHPFLLFDRDVFYERTAVGMDEDTRRVKHNDGLRLIALPILKPEEFKAYDYSFIY